MDYIIEASGIFKRYKKTTVLSDLSIHVPKGSIYGLIGKNGAGKTSLMRIISGLTIPNEGTVSVMGVDSTSKKISEVRAKTSIIIETPAFYGDVSVYENMVAQCRIKKVDSFDSISRLLEMVGLAGEEKKLGHKLSLGMKQRLGIAMAMVGNPEIIILDEPMNGLDPQGMIDIRNIILDLNRNYGVTFLISSHLLEELAKVATHFGFIDEGKLIKEISSEEIDKQTCKTTIITTTDNSKTALVLDEMGLDYSVENDTEIKIYKEITLDQIADRFSVRGITLKSLSSRSESLESFYLGVMSKERQ